VVERLADGEAELPRWQVDEWLEAMEVTSICGLGQGAPLPMRSAFRHWPELFETLGRGRNGAPGGGVGAA
jgi:NADH:ubiquinone oxidoreductase subunit F (NADH-binding)